MKISIVTAYFNRKQQFLNTLLSIKSTYPKFKDVEIIVVDDASDDSHKIQLPIDEFDIKIINVENKLHVNPCVPFNLGIQQATGDMLVIQNPECFHSGNILSYIEENLGEDDYFSFGVYSVNEDISLAMNNVPKDSSNYICEVIESISPLTQNMVIVDRGLGWYNHSRYRPIGYHFLSAVYRKHVVEMGGFDEKYASGLSYDDDDFLYRIKLKGLKVKIIDDPFAIHQWHPIVDYGPAENNPLVLKNRDLFEQTKQEG